MLAHSPPGDRTPAAEASCSSMGHMDAPGAQLPAAQRIGVCVGHCFGVGQSLGWLAQVPS